MKIKAITMKSPGSDSDQDTLETHLKEIRLKTGIEEQEGQEIEKKKKREEMPGHDKAKGGRSCWWKGVLED